MTRKDFETVAACIRVQTFDTPAVGLPPAATPVELARRIAGAFAHEASLDNPRFDRARFLRACGFDATGGES